MNNIREWYIITFPTDELGHELDSNATFLGLLATLNRQRDVYDYLGVFDSIVRERVFEKLSELIEVDYSWIFNKWLKY